VPPVVHEALRSPGQPLDSATRDVMATERLAVLGGDASLGLVPGLSLSGGVYKDVLRSPQTLVGPEGQMTQIKKSVPEFDKPQPVPDVRIMLNVDLLKFKPGELLRQIKGIF
jgi:hypothetical protein